MKKQGAMSENPSGLAATTQCQRCRHFNGYDKEKNQVVCKAFPDGIPDEVLFDDIEHNKILEGQTSAYIYTTK